MSHNKITINNQAPNSNGNVSVAFSDLSDANFSSLASNHIPKWDGSQWVNGTAPAGSTEYIRLGQGESAPYTQSNQYPFSSPTTVGTSIGFYDTSVVNTITNATVNNSSSTNNWYDSITLPSGTYYVTTSIYPYFYESGYLFYLIQDSNNNDLSVKAVVGDLFSASIRAVKSALHVILDLNSQTTIKVVTSSQSGVISGTGYHTNFFDRSNFMIITKL